jgi:fused signal recognition particle receptor
VAEVSTVTLAGRLGSARGVFARVRGQDDVAGAREVIEEVLLRSDVGVSTTARLLADIDAAPAGTSVVERLRASLLSSFVDGDRQLSRTVEEGRIAVWLFVGVNGVGKTTTIGKLAARESAAGSSVVLAAGDTFRAAAADQLAMWAERSGADIVRGAEGSDPSSIIHDAIERGAARGASVVLADTAGRLHTNNNLLDELSKVRRVADRGPGQVTETILVVDATTGQNALSQARQFLAAAQVSGIALTKLDGTARGGIVVALESELGIPVKLVGVGEGVADLMEFSPSDFVDALLAP